MLKKTLALTLLLLFSGCTSDHAAKEQNSSVTANKIVAELNTTEPSLFTLTTIDNHTFHLNETEGGLKFQELENKMVFLIFFGYRCPPCLREIPVLIDLKNKGYQDLEIVAIEVQGLNQEKLKEYAAAKGINYPLIVGEEHRDFIGYIMQKANWHGNIPFLLAFDQQGVVKIVQVGGLGKEHFEMVYQQLSQKP